MAKIAFWIMSGPDQEEKVIAALRFATRLKTVRKQDVQVYVYGPALRLVTGGNPDVRKLLDALVHDAVPLQACPVNAEQVGIPHDALEAVGVSLRSAGEVMVELVEQGYQVIGV